MITQAHIDHIDHKIKHKREQITRQARDIIESMERLIAEAESGYHVRATPIQHNETSLNTLCGELAALVEARAVFAHAMS